MGYIEQNLVADERIIFKGEIHWMRYARPILIIFLGVLALYWNMWAVIAGVILMLIGIFQIAYIYFGLSYAVTNKRIILKKGILNVEALEIILTKVEGVHIEQSFLGRLLNYGTVVVTTGEVINRFEYLAYPAQFSNSVHEVVQSLDTEDPTRLSQIQTNSKSAKLPNKGCLIILVIIALAIIIAKNDDLYYMMHGDVTYCDAALKANKLSIVFEDIKAARETLDRVRQFISSHPTVYLSTHCPEGYENLEMKRVMTL